MSDERPLAPLGDSTDGPEAALPSPAEAAAAEAQTSAEPPAQEKPPEPTGICLKCGREVVIAATFDTVAGRSHRRGAKALGEACGPVAVAFLYNVFAWGPNGPLRLVMSWPRPVVGDAILQACRGWEATLSAKTTVVDEKGSAVIGEKAVFIVQSWVEIGAR
jgi:hypothetical protein